MPESQSGTASAVSVELPSTVAPVVARLVLEITRGKTRFRQRPVAGPRFLIGAGVTCDLRLGGEGVPPLHSLVTIDETGVHIEAIVTAPTLIVNGRGVHETVLSDGDVISIGDVELVARVAAGRTPAGVQVAEPPSAAAKPEERPLSELSASELLDRIEADQAVIDQLEAGQRVGARALTRSVLDRTAAARREAAVDTPRRRALQAPHFLSKRPQVLAARGRAERTGESAPAPLADPHFLDEVEELGRGLTSLSQELRDGAQKFFDRESRHAAATEAVMETQERLASQLETLLAEVAAMQEQQPAASRPRAIA